MDNLHEQTDRILLVDDEDPIVRMEKQMLERLGYHVTARTSSIETLETFRTAPDTSWPTASAPWPVLPVARPPTPPPGSS